jgi:acyl-[acyl-carrier-protein]-phospholipid O-acyltransferase/long-chain-fatty-acid--[acyl-carrier-protein] ligase
MLLHHRFVYSAKKQGKNPAFIDRSAGKTISWSRALLASLILAKKFRRHSEGFIGIMVPTSAGCGLAILGALISGRTPVMINYSTGAEANAKFAQRKCGFRTIITSKKLLEKINCPHIKGMIYLEEIMDSLTAWDKVRAALISKLPAGLITRRFTAKGEPDDNLVILFTSGSEKEPKAVQLTHRNISFNIESFCKVFQISEGDRMMANLPLFHVFGLTVNFWTPIYHGITMVTYANPTEYQTVAQIIRDDKPTILVSTPSFFQGYLRRSKTGDFESLRVVISGADKCPDALRQGYLNKHGVTLFEGYGATETSPVISVNYPGFNRPGSVGRPLPNVAVFIENYETGEKCAPGEVGRIMVRGELVMKGYFDDLEETAMRIRHGWYDTGDMGYIDEGGFLWHSGRLKRFVKIGGEMVSLVQVEDRIEKLLPDDVDCCVVEIPDVKKGAKIIAVVTKEVDEKDLRARLSGELPNIALPSQYVVMEKMPEMGSGKIDFRSVTNQVHDQLLDEM